MGTAPTLQRDDLRKAERVVRDLHAELERNAGLSLPLRLWDGTLLGDDSAGFRIHLEEPWVLRALARPPFDLSAGEAYVEGAINLEGDIVTAMGTGARVAGALATPALRVRAARMLLRLPRPPRRSHRRRARLRGRRHSPDRDRAAIAFHYDLPQTFYEQFLDRNLVYSCAYWRDGDDTLENAQIRKLEAVCRKLRLRPGMRLLDVGCGWGSLLTHAARHHGVTGVGVTLSQTQAEAGRERLAAAGLADRVDIRLADYRELRERFDAVSSIGMFEHVGPDQLESYFRSMYALTEPGGLMLNHGIVTGDAEKIMSGKGRSFVSRYVFPDGGLVPAWRAVRELQRGGFELFDVEQLRPHYARTLREWVRRIERNHETAVGVTSEVDYRVWRAYMAGSALNFSTGDLGVIQILGVRATRGRHDLGFGRAWTIPPTDVSELSAPAD